MPPSVVTKHCHKYNQHRISTTIIYKEITRIKHLPYTKRLEFLGIDSSEIRRLLYDLIFVNKMLCGLVDLKFCDYFTLWADTVTDVMVLAVVRTSDMRS